MNAPSQRVNHRVADRDLKYYIFDWDDNILHMPTRIHLEKRQPDGSWAPHTVSTAVFALIRGDTQNYRAPGGDWQSAFRDFQDPAGAGDNAFLRDTDDALARLASGEERPGPSFRTFRRTLVEGRLFAIVTARGHASTTLREGVRRFIARVLTAAEREEMLANLRGYRAHFDHALTFGGDDDEIAYYLDLNRYHAVTSPGFNDLFARAAPGAQSPEARKQFAIRDFVEHVVRILSRTGTGGLKRPISVGFSDDDPANVTAVEAYIREELGRHFPGVKFVVYDTSDRTLEKGRKIVVHGQLDLGIE